MKPDDAVGFAPGRFEASAAWGPKAAICALIRSNDPADVPDVVLALNVDINTAHGAEGLQRRELRRPHGDEWLLRWVWWRGMRRWRCRR